MIWEPFLLALVLGLVVSAGLYFAYLWPSVEPVEEGAGEPAPLPGRSTPAAEPSSSASRSVAAEPPGPAGEAPDQEASP